MLDNITIVNIIIYFLQILVLVFVFKRANKFTIINCPAIGYKLLYVHSY